jgi:hypothetical protein
MGGKENCHFGVHELPASSDSVPLRVTLIVSARRRRLRLCFSPSFRQLTKYGSPKVRAIKRSRL